MLEIIILVLSVTLQLMAALLALQLIRATHHRAAWILIAAAAVVMTLRRVIPLVRAGLADGLPRLDPYEIAGLAVSALLLAGLLYIRRYLFDTFAAERVVRDSEERYRYLAKNIPDAAVFLLDRSQHFTLAAGPALQWMGIASADLEGKKISDSAVPDTWSKLFLAMQQEALTGSARPAEQAYGDRCFSVQCVPVRNAKGEIDHAMAIAQDITHKVNAERERKAAYGFLQHTIDGVAEPVMVIGLDYEVRLMNRVAREASGDGPAVPAFCYAVSHHRQAPCSDTRHPCPLEEVRRTLVPATVEHEHITAHGEIRQVEIVASPLFDEDGKLQGVIEACRDVTERKAAEQALRRREHIFRGFLEQAEDAILLTNEDGKVINWSRGAERLTGFSRESSQGQYIWDIQYRSAPDEFRTPGNLERIKETLCRVLATGRGELLGSFVDAVVQRPDGERRSVQTMAFTIETDKGFLLGSILRDVTEIRRTEKELIRLRKAVEASGEVVLLTDRNGVITFVNPEFTRLYGYRAEEVVGKATPRVLKSGKLSAEQYAAFWQAILEGQVLKQEIINRTKDGKLLTIEASVNPVFDEDGSIGGFLAIQRDITERKRAEQELDHSEKRLRALIENGVDYISLVAADGRLLWESPSARRMLGYGENALVGTDSFALVHPDDIDLVRKRFSALVAAPGRQDRAAFRLKHRDGSWRWVEAAVTNLLNEPSVNAVVANYHDVTERKEAERERNRLLSAIENSIDGIAIADENDRFVYENHAHAQIHGFGEGELIGQTWRVLVPGDAVAPIEAAFARELRNREVGRVVTAAAGLKKDGSPVPIEFRANALWNDDGQYAGHICHVFDISERVEADAAMRRRTEELETLARVSAVMRTAQSQEEIFQSVVSQVSSLFECEGCALSIFDGNHEQSTVRLGDGAWGSWTGRRHKAAEGITGQVFKSGKSFVATDLTADPIFHWRGDPDDIRSVVCVPLVTSQSMIGTLWLGRTAPFTQKDMGLLVAIADMAANALQRQALHEDLQAKLQDLQQAQTHIIQSEKLAAIGQLVSGIAHELNNPLTSVVLYAQMLQRRFSDAEAKRDLDSIVAESLRASKIVRGLLDFARQRPPENRTVNVNAIVRSAVELVSYELRAHDVRYELNLDQVIPTTLADAHQLQQVFVNLANNAWQAISSVRQGGNLWISTELAEARTTTTRGEPSRVVRVSFRDDGPGIPKARLASIFDPFFTTKPEGGGTGLGLSICYGIVSKHGGTIRVESQEGQGAVFIVELPVVEPTAIDDGSSGAPAQRVIQPEHGRILIIDDERSVLEVLSRALRSRGYEVDALGDAAAAVRKIADSDYAVILCDIRMPGLSGPEFHAEVRSKYPQYIDRIVFVTGDVVNARTQIFIEKQNINCLTKPFELDQLYRIVQTIEELQRPGRALAATQ